MLPTTQKLKRILDQRDRRYSCLQGKFHAHLTIQMAENSRDECKSFCRRHKVKLTTIDLESNVGRRQTDVMLTSHYLDNEADAVFRIVQHLSGLSAASEAEGYGVVRAKLEHESLPSFASFDDHRYHEVHLKLRIPNDAYDQRYAQLKILGNEHNFVPSRNPYSSDREYKTQFVNMRIYQGDHLQATARIEAIVDLLKSNNYDVTDVKRETVVFDTAQELDRWWA